MTRVRVSLAGRGYDVLIGRGLLRRAGGVIRRVTGARAAVVVSAAPVRRLHGAAFAAGCRRAGLGLRWLTVPDGERAKAPDVLVGLLRALARAGTGRDAVVVALGGGSVSDVSGLAAALYARGIAWVAVPTTLEAQVDAAIGGKTAVNLPEGKNLAGAFHQPALVVADPAVLATLPLRQVRAGLAEVVKYGAIASARLFGWMEAHAARLGAGHSASLARAVGMSAAIKARVVGSDEREGGARIALNFGHTAGHALEAAAGYGRLLHGEAVAIGMVCAARLSRRTGLCSAAVPERIERLLRALRLPVEPPRGAAMARARLAAALGRDKKRRRGALRLVLLRRIGDYTVRSGATPDQLLDVLLARGVVVRSAGRKGR